MKTTVGILFGGVSSEHEVSCISAASIIRNIPLDKYDIIKIGITKEGRWLRFNGEPEAMENGKWVEDPSNAPCIISPDRLVHGLVETDKDGKVKNIRLDVVFPVLHGKNGEDGTMQGLLMLAGIPFVGCDLISSAVCMDKTVTNMLCDHAGIRKAEWCYTVRGDGKSFETFADECEASFPYPMFVKPANAGSSVGVSKARNRDELKAAYDEAFRHDRKVLVEREIKGQEIECAVLGNSDPVASVVGEIAPEADFYDYEAKYISGTSALYIPARISDETMELVRSEAVRAYKMLGCSGLSRVDFLLEESTGLPYLNELNTLPGFTSISMYPKLFDACGICYSDLIIRLIELAAERTEEI